MLKAIPTSEYKPNVHKLPIAVTSVRKADFVAIELSEDGWVVGAFDFTRSPSTVGYFGIALGDYEPDQECLLGAQGAMGGLPGQVNIPTVWIIE